MELLTHVAAIMVGVVVTLALVGVFSSNKTTSTSTTTKTLDPSNTTSTLKKKKKNKKKAKVAPNETTTTTDNVAAATTGTTDTVKQKAKSKPVPAPATAPATAPAKVAESNGNENSNGNTNANGKGKKKKKKTAATTSSTAATTKAPVPVAAPTPTPAPASAPSPQAQPQPPKREQQQPQQQEEEEWSNVVDKSKKRKKKKPVVTAAPVAASTATLASTFTPVGMNPVVTSTTSASATTADSAKSATTAPAAPASTPIESLTVSVDPKKVGIIIGPKGATMMAIQEATGCKLDINAPSKDDMAKAANTGPRFLTAAGAKQPTKGGPTATVVVSGGDLTGRQTAKKAITELANKGYATLLQGEDFTENSISVHPRFLSEIVGPGGRTIKALQETLSVKVTIPPTDWKPNQVQTGQVKLAKVGIAGPKDAIKETKEVIRSLMKWHHHEVTHPGLIHEEVHVPQEFYHCVIGPRGSEIKHIRGNFKVDVYLPKDDTPDQENTIVVGRQTDVERAIAYIGVLMERDSEQRERKYNDEFYG